MTIPALKWTIRQRTQRAVAFMLDAIGLDELAYDVATYSRSGAAIDALNERVIELEKWSHDHTQLGHHQLTVHKTLAGLTPKDGG